MKLHKCFKQALNMVLHSRLRSWLTILGIVIGVASVIAIVAVGDGMEQSINSQINTLGANLITVTPGASRASSFGPRRDEGSTSSSSSSSTLGRQDLQVLKGIPEIKYINTKISGTAEVVYQGESGDLTITGVDQKVWSEVVTDKLDQGRFLDSADSNVVVIGYDLANKYFKDEVVGINKILVIEGRSFRVVGILEDGTRNSIYMPIETAFATIPDAVTNEYDSIELYVKDEVNVTLVTDKIDTKLMNSRHVKENEKDYSVRSNSQANNTRTQMLTTLTTFLTGIAAISLLVGAVGIANTMFTSVLEKTKDIGIMKAIGAKNRDILTIFLFNAAIIGLIGGLFGILLGIIISVIMTAIGMTSLLSVSTMIVAILISIFVGILAGFVPARQGSKLKPVDALRYE